MDLLEIRRRFTVRATLPAFDLVLKLELLFESEDPCTRDVSTPVIQNAWFVLTSRAQTNNVDKPTARMRSVSI
jgi:hypothetical protein